MKLIDYHCLRLINLAFLRQCDQQDLTSLIDPKCLKLSDPFKKGQQIKCTSYDFVSNKNSKLPHFTLGFFPTTCSM